MSKERELRLKSINQWPVVFKFDIEDLFENKVKEVGLTEVFHPFELPKNDNVDYNKVVSFLLDGLYMIPYRSDIAFDFVWRALEYIFTHNSTGTNITKLIQNTLNSRIENVISNDVNYKGALSEVFKAVPHQVCEYLLKKITNEKNNVEDSKFYKRLVLNDGNANTKINNLDMLMHYFSQKDYSDIEQRRGSASLLKKIISGETITLGKQDGAKVLTLSESEQIRLITLGLLYTFRNDRTHAEVISPFKSSKASMKTYAHAWYLFLLTYTLLMIMLKNDDSPVKVNGDLNGNVIRNVASMKKLFGRHLRA